MEESPSPDQSPPLSFDDHECSACDFTSDNIKSVFAHFIRSHVLHGSPFDSQSEQEHFQQSHQQWALQQQQMAVTQQQQEQQQPNQLPKYIHVMMQQQKIIQDQQQRLSSLIMEGWLRAPNYHYQLEQQQIIELQQIHQQQHIWQLERTIQRERKRMEEHGLISPDHEDQFEDLSESEPQATPPQEVVQQEYLSPSRLNISNSNPPKSITPPREVSDFQEQQEHAVASLPIDQVNHDHDPHDNSFSPQQKLQLRRRRTLSSSSSSGILEVPPRPRKKLPLQPQHEGLMQRLLELRPDHQKALQNRQNLQNLQEQQGQQQQQQQQHDGFIQRLQELPQQQPGSLQQDGSHHQQHNIPLQQNGSLQQQLYGVQQHYNSVLQQHGLILQDSLLQQPGPSQQEPLPISLQPGNIRYNLRQHVRKRMGLPELGEQPTAQGQSPLGTIRFLSQSVTPSGSQLFLPLFHLTLPMPVPIATPRQPQLPPEPPLLRPILPSMAQLPLEPPLPPPPPPLRPLPPPLPLPSPLNQQRPSILQLLPCLPATPFPAVVSQLDSLTPSPPSTTPSPTRSISPSLTPSPPPEPTQ